MHQIRTQNIPAIVISAFNRAHTLDRLLQSIVSADFMQYDNIPLIISIDKSDCKEVYEVAEGFLWPCGPKTVVRHQRHLGLKEHILTCGSLSAEYGAVILLEDDLFVARSFYDYAVQAMDFYQNDSRICGISLYAYDFNEHAQLAFYPLDDGYDNCFIQTPSSWGQLWTHKQWHDFHTWYQSKNSVITDEAPIPDNVLQWPESSWKKYFINYMVAQNRYFVFPRSSLTTNFGDIGTHYVKQTSNYQVPLQMIGKKYIFSPLDESKSVYDSHFEILAQCLKPFNFQLKSFDFECDLYGTKNLKKIKSECLLTIRDCRSSILSYGSGLLPQELNIIFNRSGSFFNLSRLSSCRNLQRKKRLIQLKSLNKDYGVRQEGLIFFYDLLDNFRKRSKVKKD
ncbi:MAG TPA: glycosyltransferase [Thermodesulfovibrionia bacterium]|nr:glycosyltransferase [Thermodesulfovibrionia bacterium]